MYVRMYVCMYVCILGEPGIRKMVVGINHFSLSFFQILGVFQESGVMFEDVQKFEDLLMQQREFFAEEEIKYSFPRLMEFVIRVS
jgi:hypothetical protein